MMRSYLKYRPAWAQLIIFLLFAFGLFLMAGMLGTYIVARANGIDMATLQAIVDGSKINHAAARNVLAGTQIVQFLAIFIIPSVLFSWLADPQPLQFAGLRPPGSIRYFGYAGWLVPVSLFMVGILSVLNKQIPLPQSLVDMEHKQDATIGALAIANNAGQLLVSIFVIGVLAAVGEELFFRGILQRIMIQLFKNHWAGIVVTAALFSALHMQFSGFLPRMALGVALGALYWYSGSLWPGILFHFLYNSMGVIMAYFKPETVKNDAPVASGYGALYVLGVLSIAAVVYLILQMKKYSQTEYAKVYPLQEPTPFDV